VTSLQRSTLRPRIAVYVVFGANGAMLGSWVPRIPEVKQHLGLSPAVLGVVLLGMAVGALLAMPFAGGWAGRVGSATATRLAALAFFPLAVLIGIAPNGWLLFAVLLAVGASMGSLDVVMNAQGVTVERAHGRSVMSGFHATFSLGALLGAGIGGAGAALGVNLAVQLAVLAAVLLAAVLATSAWMLHDRLDAAEPAPMLVRPRGPQVVLAAAAFCVLTSEGAAADWSAVYLRENLGAGPGAAGAAFAAFSAAMTIGRLLGDAVLRRYPRRVVVRTFAAGAALGLGAGLALATALHTVAPAFAIAAAVAGFTALGAGISLTFPALLAEAGATSARPAEAIGAVSTGGYLGFLVGPPAIGSVAQLAGLPVALWLIPALAATAALLAGRDHARRRGQDVEAVPTTNTM
jgi:MFS family permease